MKKFPSLAFSDVSISSNSPAYISTAQSLKTIAASTGAQRFEFELTTAWHSMALARALSAFLNAVGQHEKFKLQVPLVDTPNGAITGAVTVLFGCPVGCTEVYFINFAPQPGDFVQFSRHRKAYQVVSATDGKAILYPPLIHVVGYSERVTVNNLTFTVRNKGDVSSLKSKKNNQAKLKLKVIEAF